MRGLEKVKWAIYFRRNEIDFFVVAEEEETSPGHEKTTCSTNEQMLRLTAICSIVQLSTIQGSMIF